MTTERPAPPEIERLLSKYVTAAISYAKYGAPSLRECESHRDELLSAFSRQEEPAPDAWKAFRAGANQIRALLAAFDASQRALEDAQADAARWRRVKPGLFITPHPIDPEYPSGVEVVFQSGSLDEVANEMYYAAALVQDDRGIVFDVVPVIDEDLKRRAARSPQTLGSDT